MKEDVCLRKMFFDISCNLIKLVWQVAFKTSNKNLRNKDLCVHNNNNMPLPSYLYTLDFTCKHPKFPTSHTIYSDNFRYDNFLISNAITLIKLQIINAYITIPKLRLYAVQWYIKYYRNSLTFLNSSSRKSLKK